MKNKGSYYLTTAIAYTSGKPHIGNVYEIVLSDAIARYKKLEGYDVLFQTGTDEHGQKNEITAKELGITPKAHVDNIAALVKSQWDLMNTSYDTFIRTTDDYHKAEVQKMFKRFYEQGDIYKGEYSGMYCTPCEAFFTSSQLVDGKCPDCGREVSPAKEEAYFFKMSKYADRLIQHINDNPDFILPASRRNEMMNNFLLPGLHDLCVSRTSFTWGIPVDFDPEHVVYVWLDALTNYITGIGYHCDGSSTDQFKMRWPADVHIIGKDIIRFHTLYWPIFLMALDLPLPKHIFGHPWVLRGDGKMSKSKGNVIYADQLVEIFGVDAVRYYLLHEMPFDNDGILTWDLVTERTNTDLANTIGNLVNRTISMCNKYFDGVVENRNVCMPVDEDLKIVVTACRDKVTASINSFHIGAALSEITSVFQRLNKYIDETLPWALAKEEDKQDRLATVLYNLVDSILVATTLLHPFLPATAEKICTQLNTDLVDYERLNQTGLYPSGGKLTDKPEILFARLDLEEVQERVAAFTDDTNAKTEQCREEIHGIAKIDITTFAQVDLRVAEILACEPIKRAKKLLKFTLNDGTGIDRTVVSGIAQWYKPEDLVGHHIILVSNLNAATICGVESQGMILSADISDDNVQVIFVDNLPAGSSIH